MPRAFILLWAFLLYLGSLVVQFLGLSLALEVTTWSLLLAVGVVVSPFLVKKSHSGLFLFFLGLAFLYLVSLLLIFGPVPFRLRSPEKIYLLWHLVLLGGYFYASVFLRIPRLMWFTLLGLLFIPLYFFPPLVSYQPLVFGLVQTALLLFIMV